MRMTFFWGTDLGEFFIQGLTVKTAGALAIACGVVALFAILYEGIKVSNSCQRIKIISCVVYAFLDRLDSWNLRHTNKYYDKSNSIYNSRYTQQMHEPS